MLIIGNSGVGKSCLLLRYAENSFNENFFNTIGVDFKLKTVKHENDVIKLQIWDTAGQESFRSVTRIFYKGANVVFLCFDLTREDTFNNLQNWLNDIR